jgi:hypothetical protein
MRRVVIVSLTAIVVAIALVTLAGQARQGASSVARPSRIHDLAVLRWRRAFLAIPALDQINKKTVAKLEGSELNRRQ